MKQEIVIRVQMNCDKCRTKAMEVGASAQGVDFVSLSGEEKNELVVVGDGVDSVNLASILRRKVGSAYIIKVGEPKKNGKKDGEKEKDKEKDKENDKEKGKDNKSDKEKDGKMDGKDAKKQNEPKMEHIHQWYPNYSVPPQVVVYESPNYSNPNCLIM